MRFLVNKEMTREEAEGLWGKSYPKIALDIETVSLTNRIPLGIGVALSKDIAFYFFNPEDVLLNKILEQPVYIHNAKFDLPILKKLNIGLNNWDDTLLLAYCNGVLEWNEYSLAQEYLHRELRSVTSLWVKKEQGNINIDHIELGQICMTHALATYEFSEKFPCNELYKTIDKPMLPLLIKMEEEGLLVDQYELTKIELEFKSRALQLEKELKSELGGILLTSNSQVAKAFKSKGIQGVKKTKKAADSVSEEALKPLHHPLADKYLLFTKTNKMLSTYIPAFRAVDKEGRIHTSFGYTKTGRYNSSEPNFQNLTRGNLRNIIIASPGYTLVSLDGVQLEMYVMGILSQDPVMLDFISKGEDFHSGTCMTLYGKVTDQLRYDSKQGNFATAFGASFYKLAEMLNKSDEEAKEFMRLYFDKFKVLKEYIDKVRGQASKDGYVVNMFGRKRPIPEIQEGSFSLRAKGERESFNTLIQGTAVDIIKMMMLHLNKMLPEVRLVNQVHDEILYEVKEEEIGLVVKAAKEVNDTFSPYKVKVSVGKSYGKMEENKV